MTERAKTFGNLLREARKDQGLTLRQAADLIGTSPSTWCRMERATHEPLLFAGLDACRALGVDIDKMIGD